MTDRSTEAVAIKLGSYLLKSRSRISDPTWAGMVTCAVARAGVDGEGEEGGRGTRVSQILREPSDEQDAMMDGCEGENRAA